eukprot:7125876-Ditylum_brightwellii.AAC.1
MLLNSMLAVVMSAVGVDTSPVYLMQSPPQLHCGITCEPSGCGCGTLGARGWALSSSWIMCGAVFSTLGGGVVSFTFICVGICIGGGSYS